MFGMTAYRRWRVAGGTYFFTQVVEDRRPILTEEIARTALRSAFVTIRRKRPFRVDAIVLLPDHLHTVWTMPEGDCDYATRWRLVKKSFTRQYLAAGGQDAPRSPSRREKSERAVWQRRYFEHTCRDEADLKRCVDYVHVNPLKHGLVERVADWPWSSFHRYVRLGEYTPDWGSANVWYGDEFKHFE
jgi:putative transposase